MGTHGGKRDNSGRKRKYQSLENFSSQNRRVYLSLSVFSAWREAKNKAGYQRCSDSDFASHLLSLEYRRRSEYSRVFHPYLVYGYISYVNKHLTGFLIVYRAELPDQCQMSQPKRDEPHVSDSERSNLANTSGIIPGDLSSFIPIYQQQNK